MNKIKSLYYHNPAADGFQKMIAYYKRRGYRFISVEELKHMLLAHKPIAEKLIFVSFDDGWRGNLKLLPIIEKYEIPICIFVATEPLLDGNFWWEYVYKTLGQKGVERYKQMPYIDFSDNLLQIKDLVALSRSALTVDEIKMLSHHPLVSIQSHTVTHPILTNVTQLQLEKELSDSKVIIERLIGKEVFAFSYPNGSLSNRETEMCKRYYSMAFTTEQNNISIKDDIYALPRYALTGSFARDLLKVWGIWKYLRRIKDSLL